MAVAFAIWCKDTGFGCILGTWMGTQQCRGTADQWVSLGWGVDLRFSVRRHTGS